MFNNKYMFIGGILLVASYCFNFASASAPVSNWRTTVALIEQKKGVSEKDVIRGLDQIFSYLGFGLANYIQQNNATDYSMEVIGDKVRAALEGEFFKFWNDAAWITCNARSQGRTTIPGHKGGPGDIILWWGMGRSPINKERQRTLSFAEDSKSKRPLLINCLKKYCQEI
ncbi:MAG: hypothetical protein LBS71_01975 [Puniceicoccales bacterium]|jgi:hypothetical protein|nr:hypothetical protein [Puniceicoccales bacterium]